MSGRAFLCFSGNPPLGKPRLTRAAFLYRQNKKNYGFGLTVIIDAQINIEQHTVMIVSRTKLYFNLRIPCFSSRKTADG